MDNIAIIIPSLDPDEKLSSTVDGMIDAGFKHVILVDDGSSEEHKEPFRKALAEHPECSLVVHEVNKGKGRALRDAFAYVAENMPQIEGVITVDGDGQHTPADTLRLAQEMKARPGQVIMGCRDFSKSNVPTHNKLGNWISAFIYKAVYGIKLTDTQTGMRAVPAEYLKDFAEKVEGDRYEYETNMLIYIQDHGIPYGEIPIETVYLDGNDSSHFNVIKDSYRIYKPIILFVLGSCIATVVDLVVFTILNALTENGVGLFAAAAAFINKHFISDYTAARLFIPTVIARIVSSLVDYNFSRTKVFGSKDPARRTIWKYYVICVVRMLLSWLFLSFLTNILHAQGLIVTLLKIIVDLILFFVSYNWQRKWVFRK